MASQGQLLRTHRLLIKIGAVALITAGTVPTGAASASFQGVQNGDLAFAADCGNGQQIWSVSSSSSNDKCASYAAQTAGATDSMPYFSNAGTTLYFASNRSGASIIYSVPYTNTASVSPGGDGAQELTAPGSANDYAPTVSSDGSLLAFIRCATTCNLYTQAPVVGGTSVEQHTPLNLLAPNSDTGDADRPEIDPANSDLILYVGTDNHIHLWSVSAQTDTDLSQKSGALTTGVGGSAAQDEHPDWAPDGQALVFDSSRRSGYSSGASTAGMSGQTGNTVYVMTDVLSGAPTVAPRWTQIQSSSACYGGQEIEPVFAPNTTDDATPMVAWVCVKSGSNIQVDTGTSVNSPQTIDVITATHSVNSMVDWQPLPLPACTFQGSACSETQNFSVTVSPGNITISTPYTSSNPFELPAMTLSSDGTYLQSSASFPPSSNPAAQQIVVTSSLAGDPGWTLSVAATSLTNGSGGTLPSSGLGLTDGALINTGTFPGSVTFVNLPAHNPSPTDGDTNAGLTGTPQTWASAPAGDGTAVMGGTLTLYAGTSTPPGTYTGTITFSVS